MKPARIAIIGVAVVAGLAAAYLASGGREPAPPVPVAAEPEKIAASEVLVAAADLPVGTKLTPANLKWLPWPAEGVAPGMILKKDAPDAVTQNSGSLVRETFIANEPVSKDKLIKADAGYLSAILPEGKRALAISIDQRGSNSAGTLILPNDHVDVIHIYKDWRATQSQGSDVYASETLLQNIRVLAIGPNIEEKNGERVAVGETATLELGPGEVNTIALAQRSGTLTLSLRSVADANAPEVVANKDAQLSVIRYGVQTYVGGRN
ncbi:MAG: Flp pilus assembly protein CpaB [Hyphomicrobiales bacterium]|nr:Flp pilus assembly protein CpaB [Hyphomicrobiales bacterium]MBV8768360.1 Flp pilus assembly protein CpaB [Hyphomicrobiales bacterium]